MPHGLTWNETVEALKNTFTLMAENGLRGFDCSSEALAKMERWGHGTGGDDPFREALDAIRSDLGDCQRCKLHAKRNSIVFGEGNPQARLVFIGEGPGYDEDRKGRPFVGAAGQLLTRIIEAMHLCREDVYIGNIIKCRPPGNRNPESDEIRACLPFAERQIAAIRPEFICTLGSVATQTLLETDRPISRLRGQFHDRRGIKIMPTYHPAYLLRNAGKKREVWEDMQTLMAAMNWET